MSNLNVGLQASTKLISLLSESKSRLESNLIEFDGIYVIMNDKMSILQSNRALDEMFDGDSFRHCFEDVISKEFLNEFKVKVQKVIDGQQVESLELRLQNEKLYLVKISEFNSIRKEEGKILKITGLDITGLRDLESQIVDVLKTINLGVLFIDENNKIMPGYSEYSRIMFENDELVGLDLHELIFNNAITIFKDNEKDAINSLKSIVGKDEMEFTILSLTLPSQVEIKSEFNDSGSKYIKITVEPVVIDGVISRYMIVAQDVTALINTKELTFSKDIGSFYYELEMNPSSVEDMIRDLRALVARLPDEFAFPVDSEIKGVLHSIKGTLGMNGLSFLSKIIHNMETDVGKLSSNDEIGSLNTKFIQFKHYYRLLNELFDGSLAVNKSNSKQNNLIDIDPNFFQKISKEFLKHYFFSPHHFKRVDNFESLMKLESSSRSLINRNEAIFSVECVLSSEIVDGLIHVESFQTLKTALVHLINNSFSHGFECNSVEREIKIVLNHHKNGYELVYTDNGNGVATDKIRAKMIEAGEELSYVNGLNEKDIANTIFKSGLSTKDEVTEISGRGEGLSGVYLDITRIGGEVELTRFVNGCEFRIFVPQIPDKNKDEVIVGADIVTSAISLMLNNNQLAGMTVDPGLYQFSFVNEFFNALQMTRELHDKNLFHDTKFIYKLNSLFSINNCELVFGENYEVKLKMNNRISNFDTFDISGSLFPNLLAFKLAAKEALEVLGVKLNLIDKNFMQNSSYFSKDDGVVLPSMLRFVENYLANRG